MPAAPLWLEPLVDAHLECWPVRQAIPESPPFLDLTCREMLLRESWTEQQVVVHPDC